MNENNLQKDITLFFLDDNYVEQEEGVAYCYGGFFYEGDLGELFKIITMTKINNGLEEWMPIKWNFSKKLKKYYEKYHKIDNFEAWWNGLIQRSKNLRRDLIQEIGSIKILFSVFFDKKGNEYVRKWMLENLFQRIGLNMKSTSLNLLVCDYEHDKSKARKILEQEYFEAYYTAEGYYSGPFRNRGAFPSLTYASTYQNPFLQISDIIVGCLGNIVKSFLVKKNIDEFTKEIFGILSDKFVKNVSTGKVPGYGIISNNKEFYEFLSRERLL